MPLREDLLTPIPGENPAGSYLRYEPIYDRIKEARREDLDVPQGGWETELKRADWPLVAELCGEALATQSKDLQLAAWLTEAALRREGYSGLREGLDLSRGLLENFWDHLYPELEDGDPEFRATPLNWLGDCLDVAVKSVPLNGEEHTFLDFRQARTLGYEADYQSDRERREAWQQAMAEGKLSSDAFDSACSATPTSWYQALVADLDSAIESLERLDRVAEEKFGSKAPSFRKLHQALQEVRHAAQQLLQAKLKTEPGQVETAPAEPVVAAPASPGAAEDPRTVAAPTLPVSGAPSATAAPSVASAASVAAIPISAVPRNREEAASRIATAARLMRAESPTDPAPYLLLRGFRWGELRANGGHPEPRLLEAPPTDVRTRLKVLLLDEQWPQLLEAAEDVMATPFGRGWLDLQRHVVTACEGLGEEYDALASALRSALRSLLHDLPWLAGATLLDDTPTANPETLAWLRSEGLIDGSPAPAAEAPRRIRLAGKQDVMESATDLVRARKPEQAIELLMQTAAQERSERARFLRRLQAASIMVDAGLYPVATPMLEEMAQQIEKHELERWEAAEVIAQPLTLLYRCKKANDDGYSGVEELFLRISRLDPVRGMSLASTKPNGDADS